MLQDFSCSRCPMRDNCSAPCAAVESILPAPDQGALDDLRREGAYQAAYRIFRGMQVTRMMLDYRDQLPRKLRESFDLYYNDFLRHVEIARLLGKHRQTAARRVHDAETMLLMIARQDMYDEN